MGVSLAVTERRETSFPTKAEGRQGYSGRGFIAGEYNFEDAVPADMEIIIPKNLRVYRARACVAV
jgi:hypothetical protein